MGKEKHSPEYIYNYYKENGYIIKSIYKNCMVKDSLICPNGHEIEMKFNKFQQGGRCLTCSGKEKYTHTFVFNYYKEYNYTLNSFYKACKYKDKLTCPNGHEIEMRFNNFKNHNQRCNTCYRKNNYNINHPRYNKDRTIKSRNKYLSFNLNRINILNDDPNYKIYLEEKAKYNKNMYDIDHIFPRMAFIDNNLDLIYGSKIIKEICNSRDNLRIVNNKENKSKAAKYNQEEFINWFNQKLEKYNETPKNNIERTSYGFV